MFYVVIDDTDQITTEETPVAFFCSGCYFSVIYFHIQLKFIITEQVSINISYNISLFSCQLIITLASLLLLLIIIQTFLLTHEKF